MRTPQEVLRELGFQPISHGYDYLWSNGYRIVDIRNMAKVTEPYAHG